MTLLFVFLFQSISPSSEIKAQTQLNFYEKITVKGFLVDQNNKPIKNRDVILIDFNDKVLTSSQLSNNGAFSLSTTCKESFMIFFRDKRNNSISKKAFIINGFVSNVELRVKHNILNSKNPKDYTFYFKDNTLNQVNKTWRKTQEIPSNYRNILFNYVSSKNSDDYEPIDFTDKLRSLQEKIFNENNAIRKGCLYIEYLSYEGFKSYLRDVDFNSHPESKIAKVFNVKLDSSVVKEAFDFIPSNSKLWSINPTALRSVLRLFPEDFTIYKSYLETLILNTADSDLASEILFALTEFSESKNHNKDFLNYYGQLISKYSTSDAANKARNKFGIDSKITIGEYAPSFSLKNLDNSNTLITNENVKGKIYLIDFWATWCKPCVEDLPILNSAYDKYKAKGFEIISISLDGKKAKNRVNVFRENKYQMPWLNAILDNGFSDDLVQDFQVTSIPAKFLIDENGKIIAFGPNLYGDLLNKKLKQIFN